MKFVVVESPYRTSRGFAHPDPVYLEYARSAMYDSLRRGEAPFLSHLLYPQVLSEYDEKHRERGIDANLIVLQRANLVACYMDYGMSEGMADAIQHAKTYGIPVERRSLLNE